MDQPILREITLGALLDEAIARNPDGDAVVYADRDVRWSYREFGELVDRAAKGLMALGVKRGEKVAVWATNVPHWVVLVDMDDQFVYIHDPDVNDEEGQNEFDNHYIPITRSNFDRMFQFGQNRLRCAVILRED